GGVNSAQSNVSIGPIGGIITVKETNSCGSAYDSLTISLASLPPVSIKINTPIDTLCVGVNRTITVVTDKPGNYIYNWNNLENGFSATTSVGSINLNPNNNIDTYIVSVSTMQYPSCILGTDTFNVYSMMQQNLIIPNLITPNSDEKNDQLIIKDISGNNPLSGTSMELYNRWGGLVYHTDNYDNSWEASNVSDGIYYYHINSSCGNISYKGWLQVVK
ncbi:MAG TPA: gliding motility-associated C-terminal domain-containing protein, partial [Cytophagaceae bacterium]|nr:gliding motility-associated C-terminal domain-containing protein [Cytophagaceae bacterium]